VGSFGERLQREREMRGILLEEIAEATKIGTRMLAALEQEDFSKLPGGIFNKGFVRAYARFLGIDEEEAVSDYLRASGELPSRQPEPEVVAQQRTAIKVPDESRESRSFSLWPALTTVALVAVIVLGGWKYYQRRTNSQVAPMPPALQLPAPAVQAGQPPALAVDNKPQSPPLAPGTPSVEAKPAEFTASPAKSFVVQIRATQAAWVRAIADGAVVVDEELEPDAKRSISAKRELVLRMGNAGGVEISHNGKPLPPLGSANEVRTVTFTSDGLQ
jgi:cytoskeleton protein RodZ